MILFLCQNNWEEYNFEILCNGEVNEKGQQWMTNYVHTEKLGYARIKGKVSAQAPNVIEGVWSPDSGK